MNTKKIKITKPRLSNKAARAKVVSHLKDDIKTFKSEAKSDRKLIRSLKKTKKTR